MSGIPVTIHLDARTFGRLEKIAEHKGVTMRALIAHHLTSSLHPEPMTSTVLRNGKPMRMHDIDAWVEAARMGVTNQVIAHRYGVSKSLVSRYLRERGIHRQKPREDAA